MTLHALALTATALGLVAAPALAQAAPMTDHDATQAAETIVKKFETNYNAGDAAGIAGLFMANASYLTPGGTILTDHASIEKAVEARIKTGWTHETVTVTEAHPVGDAIWFTGDYAIAGTGANAGKEIAGHYAEVAMQDGGAWHIRMLIGNLKPVQDVTGMTAATAK